MGTFATNLRSSASPGRGRLVFHYDTANDVVTLHYEAIVLENADDAAWFGRELESLWCGFYGSDAPAARKDLLVDMGGIVVKPAMATAWNATRARMAERYIAKTYRFGGDRRTVTAVHLGQVLQRTDGTIYADREQALAALLADREAAKR